MRLISKKYSLFISLSMSWGEAQVCQVRWRLIFWLITTTNNAMCDCCYQNNKQSTLLNFWTNVAFRLVVFGLMKNPIVKVATWLPEETSVRYSRLTLKTFVSCEHQVVNLMQINYVSAEFRITNMLCWLK